MIHPLNHENLRSTRIRPCANGYRQANAQKINQELKTQIDKADKANQEKEKSNREKEDLKKTLIGATYEGGIVFYWKDNTVKHGFIAAKKDLKEKYSWDRVKEMCDNLKIDDKTGWRLPTDEELLSLYANRLVIGGFSNNIYWSSKVTEKFKNNPWCKDFKTIVQYRYNYDKSKKMSVRPIRDF